MPAVASPIDDELKERMMRSIGQSAILLTHRSETPKHIEITLLCAPSWRPGPTHDVRTLELLDEMQRKQWIEFRHNIDVLNGRIQYYVLLKRFISNPENIRHISL